MGDLKVPRQQFLIGSEVFSAMSGDEVDATWDDMVDMNIADPPCCAFDIRVPGSAFVGALNGRHQEIGAKLSDLAGEAADLGLDARVSALVGNYDKIAADMERHGLDIVCRYEVKPESIYCTEYVGKNGRMEQAGQAVDFRQHGDSHWSLVERLYRGLIVLLATRNIVREVKEHKLAKLGIGKNTYCRTTAIRIGEIREVEGAKGAGITRRPHLRRGHVRRQRYGPGFQFERKIFIEAVFVNADEGWISERTAYNVCKARAA